MELNEALDRAKKHGYGPDRLEPYLRGVADGSGVTSVGKRVADLAEQLADHFVAEYNDNPRGKTVHSAAELDALKLGPNALLRRNNRGGAAQWRRSAHDADRWFYAHDGSPSVPSSDLYFPLAVVFEGEGR